MSRAIRQHIRSNVVGYIALFFALSTGSAIALSGSNTVYTDDLVNNEVRSPDVRDDTLPAGALAAADLAPSSVGSSEVADGRIANGDLAPAARGARAYGLVNSLGGLSRSKNVVSAGRPAGATGSYCIRLADSIDPDSAELIVAPDNDNNYTGFGGASASVVEWNSSGGGCPSGTLNVRTFVYEGDFFDNHDGGGNLPGDNLSVDNQGFSFVVP